MTPRLKTFLESPVTIAITRADGDELWIGSKATWRTGDYCPIDLELHGKNETRWFPLTELEEVAPDMWSGRIQTDTPDGPRVMIRPTVETDAMSAITTFAFPHIPIPLDVLSEYLNHDGAFMPTLWAMSDDDGFVVTLMLNSDAGLYVRYANAWLRLNDPDVIDGLNVTEVDASSLDMFDQFDQAGQMVGLSAMRFKSQPVDTDLVTGQGNVTAPTVVESTIAEVKTVPVLSSAADLTAAIAAAAEDESLQWYVERRAAALGLDADFPWK